MSPYLPTGNTGTSSALVACFSALVAFTLTANAYAPVMAVIKSNLGLSYTEAGLVASAFFVGYGIGQIPWGFLVDRHGGRAILATSILGTGISTVLFSLSRTPESAIILRFISGLVSAGIFVPSIRVISDAFPERRRGIALGILGAGIGLAVVMLGIIMPIASNYFGWRIGVQLFAWIAVLDAILVWFLLGGSRAHSSLPKSAAKEFVSDPGFWILAYAHFARYGLDSTIIAWTTVFLIDAFQFPLALAGFALSLMFAATIFSDPVGGHISDRIGRFTLCASTFAILAGILVGLVFVRTEVILWILLLGAGWFVEFHRSSLLAAVPERYGVERTGSVSGVLNVFAAAGAFFLPLSFGYLRDLEGTFAWGWIFVAVLMMIGGMAVLMFRFLKPRLALSDQSEGFVD